MSARFHPLPVAAGVALFAAAGVGAWLLRGPSPEVLLGIAIGGGLGVAGILLEVFLVARALALPRQEALRVVIAGFGIRLAVLVTGLLLLRDGGVADPAAFALSFVGGFLAGLPAVASLGTRRNGGVAS